MYSHKISSKECCSVKNSLGLEQRGQHKDLFYCVKEMGLVPEQSSCLSSDARNNTADSHQKQGK